MKPRKFFNLLIMISWPCITLAQVNSSQGQTVDIVDFTNTNPIDDTRYKDIKGTPFYFKNFVKGNIVSNELDVFKDLELNFNGYSGEIEVRNNDEYIVLDKSFYTSIEVYPSQNPELKLEAPLIFERGFDKYGLQRFGIVIHDGNKVRFFKEFKVDLLEREIQDVGKTLVQKRFLTSENYYFLIDRTPINVSLNKRKILSELENRNVLEKYVKENKINLYTEEGVRRLLAYYETL